MDETVTRYLETRSPSTARAYEKCLKRFVVFYGRPFRDFLQQVDEERRRNLDRPIHEKVRPGEDVIRRFIKWHREAGYSNYSTLQSLAAIQNILKFYGVEMSFRFIDTPPARPMKENEKHEWTLDQVREFVKAADYVRDKAFILFAFQSGLSISDVLSLDYGDIKREYEAGVLPMAVEKYREKTNVRIRTFVGADAVRYLRLYLESRPDIKPEDPLFVQLGSDKRATPASIQARLRKIAKKLNFIYREDLENGYNPARPHSLRSAFRSALTGKMDGDLIEYFMAHRLPQQKSAYINLSLDALREIYASFEHLLSIEKTSRQVMEETKQELDPETAQMVMEVYSMVKELQKQVMNLIRRVERLEKSEKER